MLTIVNRICYTICILCIIAGVVVGLMIIWGDRRDENHWKYMASLFVVFAASSLTMSVNRLLDKGRATPDR
jgi:type IV secretory pathway VirB2 component (pilin)